MRVGRFSDGNGVAEPLGDLVDGSPFLNQQARERVPQNVRSHPRHFLIVHVCSERLAEIVAIQALPVFHLAMQHERFTQSILQQEIVELLTHGNGSALLMIVEAECLRVAKIQCTDVHQEPTRDCLNNLVLSQAGVKADHQNEAQVFAITVRNESVPQLAVTESNAGSVRRIDRTDTGSRIVADLPGTDAPAKERANGHQIFVRGRDARLFQYVVVLRLNQSGVDVLERSVARHRINPAPQQPFFIVSGGAGVFLALHLLLQMLLHFCQQAGARSQQGQLTNRSGRLNRFRNVASFEADHRRSDAIYLGRLEVIRLAAEENSFERVRICSTQFAAFSESQTGLQGDSKGQRIRGSNPCTSLERAGASPLSCSTFSAAVGVYTGANQQPRKAE